MCQNNSENWSTGLSQPVYWKTYPHHSNNPFTQIQGLVLQKHVVRLLSSDLSIYCSLLDGRINNKNPYICNVHSYQILPSAHHQHQNPQQQRQIVVNTDRTVDLNSGDWSKENMVKVLLGFKRLALIYGPFNISRRQICLNEHAQIKVWISQHTYKCRADFPLNNQQEMIEALVRVLQYTNSMIASLIAPCSTLREAIDKLNSMITPSESLMSKMFSNTCNLSNHKNKQRSIIELSKTQKAKMDKKQKEDSNTSIQGSPHHKFPYHHKKSALKGSADLIWRPISQINNNNNNNKFALPPSIISIQQLPKSNHPSEVQSNHVNHSTSYKLNYLYPKEGRSRQNSKNLSFTPLSRFATNEHLASNVGLPYSQRGANEWVPLSVGEGNSHINNFDITIINSNVSNYINNGSESKSKAPIYKTKDPQSKDLGKINRSGGDRSKLKAPAYFSQMGKHKSSHSQGKSYSVSHQDSLKKRGKQGDNFQHSEHVPRCFSSGRTAKKLFTFGEHISQKLFNKKQGSYLTPINKNKLLTQPNFYSKDDPTDPIYRNHTTEFFPSKQLPGEQHDSFNESRGQRYNSFFKQNISMEEGVSQKSLIPTAKSVSIAEQNLPEQKKTNFKKQLKMQFGNLFNIAQSAKEQISDIPKIKSIHMIDSESKTDLMKESILKDKIKQKQLAFAELKMEALKVLTDL